MPAASFASQGCGKVGLAECRSTASVDSEDYLCPVEDEPCDPATPGAASGQQAAERDGAPASDPNGSGGRAGVVRRSGSPQPPPWLSLGKRRALPQPPGPRASWGMVRAAWAGRVSSALSQLWQVDLRFNAWALPLQAACLAVLPVPWAFPRLLDLQLALPAAALGGARGADALATSRRLMAGFRSAYAWPFIWLIVATRMLELGRELALVSMPLRWWTDVVEVPLAATAAFAVARLLLSRLQDMVPLAAYLRRTAAAAAARGGG